MQNPRLAMALGSVLLLVSKAALAEQRDEETVPEIVITASPIGANVFDQPYGLTSIDAESVALRRAVRTTPEALEGVPGVAVQRTGPGQGSPFLRGFTGFRTLQLIDGIRLNNSVFRDGPNQYLSTVEPLLIERLEVHRGSGSVRYGSDAVGGTLQVLTREPELGDWRLRPRLYYRFASAEAANVTRGELAATLSPRAALLAGGVYRDYDDLQGGKRTGIQRNTSYSEYSADGKWVFAPHDEARIVLAYQRFDENRVPRTHSTIFAEPFHGTVAGSDFRRDLFQERDLFYLQLHMDRASEAIDEIHVSFSIHRQDEEEERVRESNLVILRQLQGFEVITYGVWLELVSQTPIGRLTYGVDYYHDEVESFFRRAGDDGSFERRPRGPVADDASYDLLGVFIEDRAVISEEVEVLAGLRYQFAHARASDVEPDPMAAAPLGGIRESFQAYIGSLRLLYRVAEGWNTFAGLSQSFRAPNLSDLTRFDVSRSGELETPAPDLDPERYLTYEVGLKHRSEQAAGALTYYFTDIDGQIVRFPTGNVVDGNDEVTKANVGDGFIHGVELELEIYPALGWTVFGGFGWALGEVETFVTLADKEREPISRVPPAAVELGVRYDEPESGRWWIESTARFVREQGRLSPRDQRDIQRIPPGGTPGYSVFDLRGGLRLTEQVRLFGAVENIGDKDYRVHGSGINEPGTNVVLGLDVTF